MPTTWSAKPTEWAFRNVWRGTGVPHAGPAERGRIALHETGRLEPGPAGGGLPPVIGCVFDLTALSIALPPEAGRKLDKF